MKAKKLIKKEENILKKEWKNIIFNLAFSVVAILIIILFYKNIMLTTVLEVIVAIIGLIKWKSKLTLVLFLFGAFWGAVSEIAVIQYSGAWNYALTNLFSIPLWLFFVWGNATAFIFETSKEIKKLGITDKTK
jgi:hypothetical protein